MLESNDSLSLIYQEEVDLTIHVKIEVPHMRI